MDENIKEDMRTEFYGYDFQKRAHNTTDGQKREMKYCDCKRPKKNGGDNYCQICDGLIANLLELPVIARLELPVNTHLASQFVSKVKEMGAKIINVVEIKSSPMKPEDGILLYIIETDKEDLITDYAFYTWIRNENFQKYYKVQ